MRSSQPGDELDRGDAWQKAVGGGFCRHEAREPGDLDRAGIDRGDDCRRDHFTNVRDIQSHLKALPDEQEERIRGP